MSYLLKTEPSTYSFADLQKEKQTVWDGIKNPFAIRNLAKMEPGEKLVIYHTGREKTAVGTATVVKVDASVANDPKVTIKVGSPIKQPKTLAEIKQQEIFADSALVRQGRLSVVPLFDVQYDWLVGE